MRLYWISQVWHCLYKLCFIDNLILVSFISCSCSNFDNQYIWFSDIVLDVISNIWCQEVSGKDAEFINLKKNVNCTHAYLEYLFNGVPSGPMRNFSKFQAMSVLLIGLQIKNWGLLIRLSESSDGAGNSFFRNLNIGCSFSPLASTCNNVEDNRKASSDK